MDLPESPSSNFGSDPSRNLPPAKPTSPPREEKQAFACFRGPIFWTRDPLKDRAALKNLARRCEQFSPLVAVEDGEHPESLFLDVTGCQRLFGGEDRLVLRVAKTFCRWGYQVRLALSDSSVAAWALTHYGKSNPSESLQPPGVTWGTVLESPPAEAAPVGSWPVQAWWVLVDPGHVPQALKAFPPEALRLPESLVEMLKQLGLSTIGQLLSIPRLALQERFGKELLDRLDQLLGYQEEFIQPLPPEETVQARWAFEVPVEDPETIAYVLSHLVRQLAAELAEKRKGTSLLSLTLYGEATDPVEVLLELFRPTCSSAHLREILELRLSRLSFTDRVVAMRLQAQRLQPMIGCQKTLFPSLRPQEPDRAGARFLERLVNRLGPGRVLQAIPVADAQPEYTCLLVPVGTPPPREPRPKTRSAARFQEPLKGPGFRSAASKPTSRTTSDSHPVGFSSSPTRTVTPVQPEKLHQPPLHYLPQEGNSPSGIALPSETNYPKALPPDMGSKTPEAYRSHEPQVSPATECWGKHPIPLRLLERPEPLNIRMTAPEGAPARFYWRGLCWTVHRISEPQRIETGWWRGETVRRDYYLLETVTGHRFWVLRDTQNGKWYLHGIFD
jgi:hypothetical protein